MKTMIIKVKKVIIMFKKQINFLSSESDSESSEKRNSINIDSLSDNSGDDEDGEGNNGFIRKNNYKKYLISNKLPIDENDDNKSEQID